MSAYLSLLNQNKVLEATGTTTVVAGASNEIYLSLGPWSNYATLNRIVVKCSANVTNLAVDVLTDGAQYRASSGSLTYVTSRLVGSGTVNFYEFNNINVLAEDATRVNLLNLRIHASSLPAGATFTVLAQGTPRVSTQLADTDSGMYRSDPFYRALLVPVSTGVAVDVSSRLTGRYNTNSVDTSTVGFVAQGDVLYLGSPIPFTNLHFRINTGTLQAGGSQFDFKYWNGSAFTLFTPIDNTSDGQATPSNFSYASGVIEMPTLSGWATHQLTFDPYYVMLQGIAAGTIPPIGASNNPARYWISIQPHTGWTGTCTLNTVYPMP